MRQDGPGMSNATFVGVDGCTAGWFSVGLGDRGGTKSM